MTEPLDPDEPTQFLPPAADDPTFDPDATQAVPPVGGESPFPDKTQQVPTAGASRTRAYVPAPPPVGPAGPGADPDRGARQRGRDPVDRALVVGIVAVLVIIVGVGAFLLGRNHNSGTPSPASTTSTSSTSTSSTVTPSTQPDTTAAPETTQPATTAPATAPPTTVPPTAPPTTAPATAPTTAPATAPPTTIAAN